MVKPADLQNPESGIALETRDAPSGKSKSLSDRLARARAVKPSQHERNILRQLSTADCFERGRDAAIRAIEDES